MENACLTFATPSVIAGDRSAVDVCAHEISHVSPPFLPVACADISPGSEMVSDVHHGVTSGSMRVGLHTSKGFLSGRRRERLLGNCTFPPFTLSRCLLQIIPDWSKGFERRFEAIRGGWRTSTTVARHWIQEARGESLSNCPQNRQS